LGVCLCLLFPTASAATSHHAFGSWDVTADDGDKAAPAYDAMHIGDADAQANQDFLWGAHLVDWIYKTKFIEVGEQVASSYYIRWTRFEFAAAATTDRFLAESGGITYTPPGGGLCYHSFKVVYEGSYTQLNGVVQTIRFTEWFIFYAGTCGSPTTRYLYYGFPESTDTNDNFFWRVVTVQNPDLSDRFCTTPSFEDYNSADSGAWTQIEENSLAPTPSISAPAAKVETCATPVRKNEISLVPGSDIIAAMNIGVDTTWLFDRRPEEILHDIGTVTETWAYITDTTQQDDVIMIEYQTDVYYNQPDYAYFNAMATHDPTNM
jgi:hypothetical protein